MRLDRYLSHATGLTRSQAQRAIRGGEVTVDGAPVRDPGFHVAEAAAVAFDAGAVAPPHARYLMLHKPAGYVCAARDDRDPTVLGLIDLPRAETLHIAGRLDLDTTGLVLLTDDGAWSHRVTAPRHKFPKTYYVELAAPLTDEARAQLARGVFLHEEKRRCLPALVQPVTTQACRLIITEGKYHQVKRMFAAVGNHVTALHRERIGAVVLDPDLPEGGYRELTTEERASFGD